MKPVTKTRPALKLDQPTEVGWYWYWPTAQELTTLTVEKEQVVEVRLTKEKLLMTEFVREVRAVAKLEGQWSKKLSPPERSKA